MKKFKLTKTQIVSILEQGDADDRRTDICAGIDVAGIADVVLHRQSLSRDEARTAAGVIAEATRSWRIMRLDNG